MLSTEGFCFFFFTRKRKGLLPHTVDSEVSALIESLSESVDWARNKCPLSALTGVRIRRVDQVRKNLSALYGDKENCCPYQSNEVSISWGNL